MANQIQGLKKVAAANRNKTKSQLRDSNNAISSNNINQTNNPSSVYRTKESKEAIRQSAQTAMDNHQLMNSGNIVGILTS